MLGVIIGLVAVIILVTYASGTTKQMMELMKPWAPIKSRFP